MLLTGDQEPAAAYTARALDIEEYHYGLCLLIKWPIWTDLQKETLREKAGLLLWGQDK